MINTTFLSQFNLFFASAIRMINFSVKYNNKDFIFYFKQNSMRIQFNSIEEQSNNEESFNFSAWIFFSIIFLNKLSLNFSNKFCCLLRENIDFYWSKLKILQ